MNTSTQNPQFMVRDVMRDLYGKRKLDPNYLTGEMDEFHEAYKDKDPSGLDEEMQDVIYALHLLKHQATRKNFPIVGADDKIKEFYRRKDFFNQAFQERNVPFHTDYLAEGSNPLKPHKIQQAFELAGHTITPEEAQQLSNSYSQKVAALIEVGTLGYQAQLDKLGFSMQALKAPLTRISGMFKSFTSPTVTNPATNAIAMKQPLTHKIRNAFTPQPKNPIIFEGESPSSPAFKAMLQRRGNPSEGRVSGQEMHNKIQSYLQRLPQTKGYEQPHGWVNKPTTTTPSMMFGATRPSIPQPTMATKIGAPMTSKEIAAHVLEKVAVSRWREAIYSGELPQREAENLKKYMGVNPDEYAASLQRGAEAHLKARGKEYQKLKPDAMFTDRDAWAKAQMGGGGLTEETGKVIHDPFGNAWNSSLITSSQGSIPDRIKGLVNAPVTKSRFKQHGALIARHEADESSFLNPKTQLQDSDTLSSGQKKINKRYIVQKPATPTTKTVAATMGTMKGLMSSLGTDVPEAVQFTLDNPQLRTRSGGHVNPKVVLNEIRNSRMLQPSAEKFNTQIRKVTGELDQIPHMSKGIDDVHNRERPRIDKKNMNRMARAMQDSSRYNINEHLRESDKWKGIVEKYKPMIEKVRDTGMELIPKITRMSNRGEGLLRKIRDFRFR